MKNIFMTKDITFFSLYSIFSNLVFETPIFIMFLTHKGLEYSEITLIFSIYAFSVVVFEYTTGVMADKYSRKVILIFSTASLILGEIAFILGNNVYYFIVGIMFVALSTAAKSGADIAYLYDKLIELDKKEDFDDLISNLGSIMLIISSTACILGAVLTKLSIYVPFYLTILFSIITIAMLINFKEPEVIKKEQCANKIVKNSLKSVTKNKILLKYVLLSIIIFPCFHILDKLFQPYLKNSGIKIEYFGVFYTFISIFQSAGTKISGQLNKKFKSENLLFFSSSIIIFGFLLMTIESSLIAYLIPVVMGIGFGIYYNINNIVVNKHIESNIRASVLSFQHALTKIIQMVIFGGISLFINNTPLNKIFLIFSVLVIISISVLYFSFKDISEGKSCIDTSEKQ